jgi:hypothetical protein
MTRRLILILPLLFVNCAAFAQGGGADEQLKGKKVEFTLPIPQGWQHVAYEKIEDKPNAKMILGKVLGESDAKATDNFNLWWTQGEDSFMTGVASFHRMDLTADTTIKDTMAKLEASGKLPKGMEVKPTQLGKYVGLVAGGPVQQVFYAAIVFIPQGKVAYVSTIVGPANVVQMQWPTYMKMVTSLDAPDLKPEKLEDVTGEK